MSKKKQPITVKNLPSLPIQMLLLHVIKNCNSPCVMCDCWKTKGLQQITREQINNACASFAEAGGRLVMVSGGEPLLRKDITQILQSIKDKGLEVSLNTNGLLLEKRSDAIKNLCDFVVISMDAVDPVLYKKIRGIDGVDKITRAIKSLQTSFATKIQLRCTLSRMNLDHFPEIIKYARTMEINGIGFSPIDYDSNSFGRVSGQQNDFDLFIPSFDEINTFSQRLENDLGVFIDEANTEGIISWNRDNFRALAQYFRSARKGEPLNTGASAPCFFPYTAVLIDYDGSARPCFYTKAFSRAEELDASLLKSPKRIKRVIDEGKCTNCRGRIFT